MRCFLKQKLLTTSLVVLFLIPRKLTDFLLFLVFFRAPTPTAAIERRPSSAIQYLLLGNASSGANQSKKWSHWPLAGIRSATSTEWRLTL